MVNNRRILISIFLITFVLRLAAAIVYLNFDPHAITMHRPFLPFGKDSNDVRTIIGDNDRYNTLAYNILTSRSIGNTCGRAPLYPFYLTICYYLFGFNIFAFFIPQILLASISSILIFFLAQRMFNDRVAIMASLFYALNPHFILFSIQLYAETLYFFLILSVFLLCQKLIIKPTIGNAITTGIFLALAALCRTVFLVFIPFAFIWLMALFYYGRRKMLISLITIFMSFSLVYGTWVARDYKAILSQFILSISKASWETKDLRELRKIPRYQEECKKEIIIFINWIRENPRKIFNRCAQQFKIFLFKPCAEGVSLRHKAVSSFIFFTIFPLGYLGLGCAMKERKKIAFLAFLFIVSMIIFHSCHFLTILDGELRYRLPVELFITIFAAYGLNAILDLFSFKKYSLLQN